jgi:hypothetical protein
LEREFKFFNWLEGRVRMMFAPGGQRKSSDDQREQAELNSPQSAGRCFGKGAISLGKPPMMRGGFNSRNERFWNFRFWWRVQADISVWPFVAQQSEIGTIGLGLCWYPTEPSKAPE